MRGRTWGHRTGLAVPRPELSQFNRLGWRMKRVRPPELMLCRLPGSGRIWTESGLLTFILLFPPAPRPPSCLGMESAVVRAAFASPVLLSLGSLGPSVAQGGPSD